MECLLLEGSRIGSGTVRHAMAQVTSQHGLIYSRLLETLGEEKARMYFEANELALHKYRELAASIDCDFEERSSYIYSRWYSIQTDKRNSVDVGIKIAA